jgi:catechol 2,3-dioxygenase-like lactoylglutathione lyase family enzyme
MIGYITFGTNDLPRAAAFYDRLLETLGAKRMAETEQYIMWSTSESAPMLCIIKPYDGHMATSGNGTMVALAAESTAQVDRTYAEAMALGAKDEGAAGTRGPGFYAAYFRDPDGNKLAVFRMG